MTTTGRIARAIYVTLLGLHPSARRGYASQMTSTFDTLLAPAVRRGRLAVVALLIREGRGLFTSAWSERRAARHAADAPEPRRTGGGFQQDVRYALRTFRRKPALTMAIVTTLALGIGANTAIFSVVNAVLLQRLPFTDPARLVMVWEEASKMGFPRNTPSPGSYMDWKTSVDAFADVAAIDQADFNLAGDSEPAKIGGGAVTSNFFSVLGVQPILGRAWRADEAVPGNHVAVLGYSAWMNHFGGDPSVLTRPVTLNGSPYTVLGVMAPRFQMLSPELEIWVPLTLTADQLSNRGDHYLSVVARLAPNATTARANNELRALAIRLQREHPDTNRELGMYAVPVLDDYLGDTRFVLILLGAAVGCVLLIACANVANLLLSRASGRAREMAVRAALGADRRRLIRQLMTESLLLAFAGGALGISVAYVSLGTLAHLVPEPLTALSQVRLDPVVLVATAGISALTGVLFGLAPAWRASRVNLAVAGGRQGSRGVLPGSSRMGHALVVVEIALAAILLVGAGLLVESFRSAEAVDPGFRSAQVLTARLQLPRRAYADFSKRAAFVTAVLDGVRALPGVVSAGYTSAVPLVWKGGTSGFRPEGLVRDASLPYDANNRVVSPGYMETIGITLRSGRFFDARDDSNGVPVAIINDRMARQYWPGLDPVGRRFKSGAEGANPPFRTIVGVVGDTRVMGIEQPTRAEMYFPIMQSPDNWMWPRDLTIRAAGDPMALLGGIRQTVRTADPVQPISNIALMDDILGNELQGRRTGMVVMTAFAGLALVLAAVGIYGVLSYAVTARTSEIGLRLALGGDPRRIRAMVVGQGMRLAATGLVLGLAIASWGVTLINHLLFNVPSRDPRVFGVQAVLLAAICFIAVYLPARRASRVDPIVALRVE